MDTTKLFANNHSLIIEMLSFFSKVNFEQGTNGLCLNSRDTALIRTIVVQFQSDFAKDFDDLTKIWHLQVPDPTGRATLRCRAATA